MWPTMLMGFQGNLPRSNSDASQLQERFRRCGRLMDGGPMSLCKTSQQGPPYAAPALLERGGNMFSNYDARHMGMLPMPTGGAAFPVTQQMPMPSPMTALSKGQQRRPR